MIFTGVSLGSILLLVALGLAITYGLMGVINMAHGELMMIGAYATYVVQNLFRAYLPGAFDAYVLAAIPVAFLVAALVGAVLERSVIRWLYGRPLETLLATWGISLVLHAGGALDLRRAERAGREPVVAVGRRRSVPSNLALPYNRIAIIAFAVLVLVGVALLIAKHAARPVRARRHAEPRAWPPASASTPRASTRWPSRFGAGIAGLAGCALSQVGNVGPDLGQGYIVDSFMVVVARRRRPARRHGATRRSASASLNKFLEGSPARCWRRSSCSSSSSSSSRGSPQGLFAMKGRSAEA